MSRIVTRVADDWRTTTGTLGSRDGLVAGEYKPDATTTGVIPGTTLTVFTGNYVFSADGETAENLEIRGYVDFNGKSNCTLRNCKVINQQPDAGYTGAVHFGVRQFGASATGTLVEDCEIYPATPSEDHHNGFWGFLAGGTIRRCNIHGWIDGVNVSGTAGAIEANWMHDFEFYDPHPGWSDNVSHNDCIQMSNADGWVIRGNAFEGAWGGTSCVFIGDSGSTYSEDNVIDQNWFDTGAVAINLKESAFILGQTITDNIAGERADFRTTIHWLRSSTTAGLSTFTGNETESAAAWFQYGNG